MRRITFTLLLCEAQPFAAAYADRDLVVPVVGQTAGGSGRLFLWITNTDDHPAVMTLSYLESGPANRSPRKTSVTLPPRQTYVVDPLGPPILTNAGSIGALRIESKTSGAALSVVVAVEDLHGQILGEKRPFLDGFEHVATDTRQMFPAVRLDHAVIRVRGVDGNGRVIAAGPQIASNLQDACAYEMSFAPEPRTRIRAPEAAAYIAIAAVVAIALLRRRQ
jgi:hypothetical protein